MELSRPLLLTPGPVSVSATTREALLAPEMGFYADLVLARDYLLTVAAAPVEDYVAVPLPGSATYANEAVIGSLVPPGRTLLVHSNGVYGDRLAEICEALGVAVAILRTDAFTPPEPGQFAAMLDADPAISHVFIVHCETSTGIVNPLEGVAALCQARGIALLVDAVASFGALPLDAAALGLAAVTISSNKCMEGVPGIGWAVVRRADLEAAPRPRALCLDLADQARYVDRTGVFRFTAPLQVLAAFAQACREHAAEGGSPARLARYRANWQLLVGGMRQMGFRTVVPDAAASPIVATFHNPDHPAFRFDALFEGMKQRGFIIFPGRLALADTFRIGCMGAVTVDDIARAMQAVAETMGDMGVGFVGRGPALAE